VAPVSQILFGTDFPYRTSADHVKGVTEFFTDAGDRQKITRDNAVGLIARPT
jgi:predicted TIM-barrel fold metal-dependent hydrolase